MVLAIDMIPPVRLIARLDIKGQNVVKDIHQGELRIAEFIRIPPERGVLLEKKLYSGPLAFASPWSSEVAA